MIPSNYIVAILAVGALFTVTVAVTVAMLLVLVRTVANIVLDVYFTRKASFMNLISTMEEERDGGLAG